MASQNRVPRVEYLARTVDAWRRGKKGECDDCREQTLYGLKPATQRIRLVIVEGEPPEANVRRLCLKHASRRAIKISAERIRVRWVVSSEGSDVHCLTYDPVEDGRDWDVVLCGATPITASIYQPVYEAGWQAPEGRVCLDMVCPDCARALSDLTARTRGCGR